MKKLGSYLKIFEIAVILNCFMFALMTILSSIQIHSDAMEELIFVKRGFPYKFIEINNVGSHIYAWNAVIDFIILLGVSLLIVIGVKLFTEASNKKNFFVRALYMFSAVAFLISNIRYSYASAANVSTQYWRLMHNGKLYYRCASKFEDYVAYAKRQWNSCQSGTISESSSPDVIIKGTGELPLDVAGITYATGVIYFNTTVWDTWTEDANAKRKYTAMHEMGHALGCAHNVYGSIMYKDVTAITTLSLDDKASFNYAYGQSFVC